MLGAEGAPPETGEVSKRLFLACPLITVRTTEVTMKIVAKAAVKRVKKLAPPELPNTVWLEPPSVALISAPLPDWTSTTRTNRVQANT